MVKHSTCWMKCPPPVILDFTAQTHQPKTHSNQTLEMHWWRLESFIQRSVEKHKQKDFRTIYLHLLLAIKSKRMRTWLTMTTLLVCSRVRMRSLLTVVSAMSALSSASSSSCWTFLKRTAPQLTCSSWWTNRGMTRKNQVLHAFVASVVQFLSHSTMISPYRILSLSLVALDFSLELINELLHPQQSLPVLFWLHEHKENGWRHQTINTTSGWCGQEQQLDNERWSDLVRQLFDFPLIATDSFLVLLALLLLHH